MTTPSSSRRHGDRSAPSLSTNNHTIPTLPPYQPPIAPLNDTGKRALASILEGTSQRHLKHHLQHAAEKLTDSAGEVNERFTAARVKFERRVEKQRALEREGKEEEWDEDGERSKVEKMEREVGGIMEDLEKGIRKNIDMSVFLDVVENGVQEMGRGVDGELENGDSGRNGRGRRGNRRRASGREGEEEEHDGEDEEPELGIPPSQQLMDTIAKSKSSWQSQSLTDRYSTNNTYIGFYRIVHDSKYADDEIPPLPHSSTWFSQYEDQPTLLHSYSTNQSTQPNNPPAPPESEDFIIERERISLKCPLTLLPFSDPVTSTKCPHSFEREAIMGMLAQSRLDRPAPGGGRRNRIRYIRCPVCSLELTKDDLKSDPVLLRKVNRAQALLQREEEEAELEGRSRRITLGDVDSGDDEDGDDDDGFGGGKKPDPVKIKQERGVSTFRGFEDDDGEC